MSEELLTGERTWPAIPRENYWFMRHLACYRWAATTIARHAPKGRVLDAGSGEGYGAALLAEEGNRPVFAVELEESTVRHSMNEYRSLCHIRANLVALPFRADAFSATVSLQVVEHIWDPVTYLRELDRCTDGPIIISTPNRPVHSPDLARGERPDNPFHVREFDAQELVDLLVTANNGRPQVIVGLSHGSTIRSWEQHHGSLPYALVNQPDAPHVLDFAATLTYQDFELARIETSGRGSGVQDLVAIW